MRPFAMLVTFLATLAISALASPAPAVAAPPAIYVDGRQVIADVPAIGDGGRMLVPLRVLEQLGAQITYDTTAGSADIRWRGVEAKVSAGSQVALVDGARIAMDYAPREFAGRMEVPLRFLTQAFHVDTDYDSGTNTIAIVTGQPHGNFVATLTGPTAAYSGPNVNTNPSTSTNSYGPSIPGAAPPTVDDMRPAPNSVVGSTYPQIYARFSGNSSSVNPSTLHIVVDGGDVTGLAAVSSAYISYTPSAGLTNGSHSVEISGQAEDGASIFQTWSFRVDAGTSYNYASSIIGYNAPRYGYGRFGYCPPGFSLYSPGPLYFVDDDVIEVIFFSRYFHYGSGFFTIGGIPGEFGLQPWYGYPGYYWGMMTVPFGVHSRHAVLSAKFKTSDGRTVVVHSTAPLRIDGQRHSLPPDVRYAILPRIVNRPSSPRGVVVFRPTPIAARPIDRLPIGYTRQLPISTLPRTVMPIGGMQNPGVPVIPLMPRPMPVPVPGPVTPPIPIAPRPLPPPLPVPMPPAPRPMPVPAPKGTPHP